MQGLDQPYIRPVSPALHRVEDQRVHTLTAEPGVDEQGFLKACGHPLQLSCMNIGGRALKGGLLGQAEEYVRPLLCPLLDMRALVYTELHHHKPAIQIFMRQNAHVESSL